MNGSTKILTVSYGTFSCTLEGFDDPLGSMREIAEYFRDLASDDRYFGAEPPTPDVEMLQKIAEKEVRRRVEARVSESGNVALVAAEKPARTEAPAEQPRKPAAERQAVTSGPLTYDDDFLMADEPEDVLTVDPTAEAHESAPAESVAEKLRRIRAVVSKSVELEDRSAIRREQAPNADDPDKRDRALSETIRQIQTDISDEDDDDTVDASSREPQKPEPRPEAAERREAPVARQEEHAQRREEPSARKEEPDQVREKPAAQQAERREEPTARHEEQARREQPAGSHEEQSRQEEPARRHEEPARAPEIAASTESRDDERYAEPQEEDDYEEPEAFEEPRERASLSPEPEKDVGRLLDQTDTKLNEDDTVRRRRVISQMRAAVAATKADRLVSRQVSREVEQEAEKAPYRADLSEAVEDESDRQPQERPKSTPLVLVSSQRIDSVQPESSSQDFAAFVASTGARELPELIEAAAAFTVFSEGQSSFTRPEIMKRVARVDPTLKLSREESLRSFGQLLRQGTFRKLERGQFTIDKGTRFNPDQRAASR